jgi:hypothetical protein
MLNGLAIQALTSEAPLTAAKIRDEVIRATLGDAKVRPITSSRRKRVAAGGR